MSRRIDRRLREMRFPPIMRNRKRLPRGLGFGRIAGSRAQGLAPHNDRIVMGQLTDPPVGRTSPFHPLDIPTQLWIPCATRPPFAAERVKPANATVARGEAIAESDAEFEPVPLSPAAGRIVETGPVTLTNGAQVPAVLIETEAGDAVEVESSIAASAHPPSLEQVAKLVSEALPATLPARIDALRRAGVWADRWTSPDLLGQLHQCLRRPVDTVVCNVLDADPSLAVNAASAAAFGAELVAGLGALARLVGATRLWVGVDETVPAARWDDLLDAAAEAANDLRIVPLTNDYPQADPSLLLYTLTRRRLRPGRLPIKCGALLLDAAAAVAVGRALLTGEPMLRVPLAVYDQPRGASHLLSVTIGTPLRHVLTHLQMSDPALALRAGGPLRERPLTPDAIVAGGELGVYALPRQAEVSPDPCIRCGWCIEGCPVNIHPAGLLEAAQEEDLRRARRFGLDACIECGICTYVCPSRLPLLASVREMRWGRADVGV